MILEKIKDPNQARTSSFIIYLLTLVIKNHGTNDSEWFCACEQIINMIFVLKQNPENLVEYLINKCSSFLLQFQSKYFSVFLKNIK